MAPLGLGNCLPPTCSAGKGARLRLYSCEDTLNRTAAAAGEPGLQGWELPPGLEEKQEAAVFLNTLKALRRQRFKNQALGMLAGFSESIGHPLQMSETTQQQILVKTQIR